MSPVASMWLDATPPAQGFGSKPGAGAGMSVFGLGWLGRNIGIIDHGISAVVRNLGPNRRPCLVVRNQQ